MELQVVNFLEAALDVPQSITISAHLTPLCRIELNDDVDITGWIFSSDRPKPVALDNSVPWIAKVIAKKRLHLVVHCGSTLGGHFKMSNDGSLSTRNLEDVPSESRYEYNYYG